MLFLSSCSDFHNYESLLFNLKLSYHSKGKPGSQGLQGAPGAAGDKVSKWAVGFLIMSDHFCSDCQSSRTRGLVNFNNARNPSWVAIH